MAFVLSSEPADCWTLVGEDDDATPPTVARVLHAAGSRDEWRRAGVPVLFDETGQPRPVVRGGRAYRFVHVDGAAAAALRHPTPLN